MMLLEKSRSVDVDSEYETTNEDFEEDDSRHNNKNNFQLPNLPTIPSLGLNNYLNNLNIHFNLNLNDRLNAFETSLWRFYETRQLQLPQFQPVTRAQKSFEVITNLWKQLADEEAEAQLKRLEFQEVQKKASAELRRRLAPKIKIEGELAEEGDRGRRRDTDGGGDEGFRDYKVSDLAQDNKLLTSVETPTLDQEYWTQFFGFKSSEDREVVETATPPCNPFFHKLHLSTYDRIKTFLLIPLVPVRIIGILICLILACSMAFIGSIGLSQEQIQSAPLSKWRRMIRWTIAHVVMRTLSFFAGFYWIRRIGKQASSKEAPILVVAPHSSYFDAFLVPLLGGPSVVAKAEAKNIPFFGRLIDFTQPIYVKREDRDSRTASLQAIHRRVLSGGEWPQVFIFPEGTCTNRSALAQFKIGAFSAGVPVQPVIVRYPNRVDSVTWTFDGPSSYWTILCNFTQLINWLEVEYLPVYTPSDEESTDPVLYARNVQALMSQSLRIPCTDFRFEDGIAIYKMKESNLRHKLATIWKLKGDLKLRESPHETTLVYEGTTNGGFSTWKMNESRFHEIFNIQKSNEEATLKIKTLFNLFKKGEDGSIDLRPYLLLVCFMYSSAKLDLLKMLMFKMYSEKRNDAITKSEFVCFMMDVFEVSRDAAEKIFDNGKPDSSGDQLMTYDEFQKKVNHHVEFLKIYSMEVTGQLSANFPQRDVRDRKSINLAKTKRL